MIEQRRYRYELRSGSTTIATGHLTQSESLQVGDAIRVSGSIGIVRAVEPILGERELRLVIQLASATESQGAEPA